MNRVALVGFALVVACGLTSGAEPKSAPPRAGAVELVVLSGPKLTRLEILVEVGGRSVAAIWDETFDKLFVHYDLNRDGTLDEKEVARLPSPFSLRQLAWGQSVPYSGRPVALKDVDADGSGAVSKAELVSYYRRGGVGQVLVGVGRPQATAALTAALLKALDTDGNGTVSEAEWKAAPESLRKLDRNDDELIGPGELVPKTAYPGTVGSVLMSPPSATESPVPELDGLPFVRLPADEGDTHWAAVVVARRDVDKDGKLDKLEAGFPVDVFAALDTDRDRKLSAAELSAWRKTEPAARHTIRLGNQPNIEPPAAAFNTGLLRFDVRSDAGKMPELVAAARTRFLDRFADADANADGFVDEPEIAKRNQTELKQLRIVADRDGDGKLSKAELTAWLDLQDQVASGHVLLTVLDYGAGLFELLDADHDGSLSVPELRGAFARVKGAGCVAAEGAFDASKVPRHLVLIASRGHPVSPLGAPRRDGPTWFRAMDRNGDGYVSRREFTGEADVFDKLDLNRDGFLGPDEANGATKLAPPRK